MSESEQEGKIFEKAARWIAKNRSKEAASAFMRKQLSASLEDLRRDLSAFDESCRKLEDVNGAAADSVRAELKGLIP